MSPEQTVRGLWSAIDRQGWAEIGPYFARDAVVNWHNTNEQFTVQEFISANAEYPGDWTITVEKLLVFGAQAISVVRVRLKGSAVSFHATSFFTFAEGKIKRLDEYWGGDEAPPKWRTELGIGRPIEREGQG